MGGIAKYHSHGMGLHDLIQFDGRKYDFYQEWRDTWDIQAIKRDRKPSRFNAPWSLLFIINNLSDDSLFVGSPSLLFSRSSHANNEHAMQFFHFRARKDQDTTPIYATVKRLSFPTNPGCMRSKNQNASRRLMNDLPSRPIYTMINSLINNGLLCRLRPRRPRVVTHQRRNLAGNNVKPME
jgi:hypothetical protein